MSLFGLAERRSNPMENPAVPLTDPGLLSIDGIGGESSYTGKRVTPATAMSLSAFFRSVALLSGTVAGLPLKAYRYKGREEVNPRPLSPYNLGPYTPFELMELVMTHLLVWGNAYCLKVRTVAGGIDHLVPIDPSRVDVQLVGPDSGKATGIAQKVFAVSNPDGTTTPLTSYEVMHIPGLGYNGVTGLSILTLAKQTLGLALAEEEGAARLFGNGTMLSGVLQTDRVLDRPQADGLKRQWREKLAGVKHAHEVAILDAGTKFQPMSIPPNDAQFLESRVFQVEEIARWFGLPPYMVGEVSKNASQGGGNGIESQGITMVRYVLNNWLCRIEGRFTREIVEPHTQFAEFVREGLLRGEIATRYAAYATAIASRFMIPDEARALENMSPLPNGEGQQLAPWGTKPAIDKPTTPPRLDNTN